MNLDKLYKMQKELDNHILENEKRRTGKEIDKDLLLDQTILALLVELGELANATRCFKHWSTKGPMEDEAILDELADVWHFYLSIGNQMDYILLDKHIDADNPAYYGLDLTEEVETFNYLYYLAGSLTPKYLNESEGYYIKLGIVLALLGEILGFTDGEVEQAYLKKHEENYRRQREGY